MICDQEKWSFNMYCIEAQPLSYEMSLSLDRSFERLIDVWLMFCCFNSIFNNIILIGWFFGLNIDKFQKANGKINEKS